MSVNPNRTGWFITMTALAINLILGVLYSWSVIKKALVADWGWSNTEASLPYTVSVATFALMMVFAGRAQDKYGPRKVALLGGLLLGAGLIASSFTQNPTVILLTFGVIGGMGIGFGYSAVTPCAIKWFDAKKKGLISGIVVSGVGLSPVYIAPITNMLYKAYGLEHVFLYLGIFALAVVCLLSLLLRNPSPSEVPVQVPAQAPSNAPAASNTQSAATASESTQKSDYTWQEMVRMPSFYLLWFSYLMSAAAGLMLIGHMASIASVQANWQAGFLLVVILAVFNFFGRIMGGVLSDKVGRTRALLLVFLIQAVNMFAFSFYTEISTLIAGSALAGLAYGALFALFPAATADLFGLKNLGVNYGLVFTGWGVAGIIGPIVGGLVADATGSYNISYVTSAVMLVIGALLVLRMKK